MSEDLTQRFDGQDNAEKLNQILSIVQSLDVRVQSLDTRVQSLDARVGNIEVRLEALEEKVEQRLYDTRPIWEKVLTDIAQLREGQEALHQEGRRVNTAIRDFNRKFSIFHETLVTMQADYRDIYDRVRDIERQRT